MRSQPPWEYPGSCLLVDDPVEGPQTDVKCSVEVVWVVILQGAKNKVKKCRALWKSLQDIHIS